MNKTKQLVLWALFIALTFVGANIKIFGTIAFDSMPAFLGTLVFGFVGGGAIAFLGHMLTALTSGFPLSLPVHLIVAVFMIATMGVFYLSNKMLNKMNVHWIVNLVVSCLLASIVNGPLELACLCLAKLMPVEVALTLIVPLFTVALINAVMGNVLYQVLVQAKVISKNGIIHES